MASPRARATVLGQQFAPQIKGKTILITGASPGSLAGMFCHPTQYKLGVVNAHHWLQERVKDSDKAHVHVSVTIIDHKDAAQLAVALAPQKPSLIILTGRSPSKLEEVAKQIKQASPDCPARNLIVDFASFASIRKAAQEVSSYGEDIDVSVLSAGVMAPPYGKTEDGFEAGFGLNHLSHFLFMNSIMGKVQAAAKRSDGARIVSVSSDGHAVAKLGKDLQEINFNDGKTYNQWQSYGQSKSANALLAISLADKLAKHSIQAYSLHPGVILSTGLGTHISAEEWGDFVRIRDDFNQRLSHERRSASTNVHTQLDNNVDFVKMQKTPDEGAATMMVAGFDPSIKGQSGGYLQDCIVDDQAVEDHAKSKSEAERLWKISEECVGQTFEY